MAPQGLASTRPATIYHLGTPAVQPRRPVRAGRLCGAAKGNRHAAIAPCPRGGISSRIGARVVFRTRRRGLYFSWCVGKRDRDISPAAHRDRTAPDPPWHTEFPCNAGSWQYRPVRQERVRLAESGNRFGLEDQPAAGVAELVDALDLGSSDESRGGSSPSARTTSRTAGRGRLRAFGGRCRSAQDSLRRVRFGMSDLACQVWRVRYQLSACPGGGSESTEFEDQTDEFIPWKSPRPPMTA